VAPAGLCSLDIHLEDPDMKHPQQENAGKGIWRLFWDWLAARLSVSPHRVPPRPPMAGDAGQRRHIEKMMEMDSRHVGR